MQPLNQPASKTIIEALMPSAWATYKHSMKASLVGFSRVVFSYQGVDDSGERVKKLGLLWMALLEVIRIPWSCVKLMACLVTIVIAISMLTISPVVNLFSLPFYRRKSIKELTRFIDSQAADLEAKKKKAEEALGGAV